MDTNGGEKPTARIVPMKSGGVPLVCDSCHVEMEWFHTQLVRGELALRTLNSFMCPNCHGVSTRVSALQP